MHLVHRRKNVFQFLSPQQWSNLLDPAGGGSLEREAWDARPGHRLGVPRVTFYLFFGVCFLSSALLLLSLAPDSALNPGPRRSWTDFSVLPSGSHLGRCQWERGVAVMGTISATPSSLSSSAPAKPWQLWKPNAFSDSPCRSPHACRCQAMGPVLGMCF